MLLADARYSTIQPLTGLPRCFQGTDTVYGVADCGNRVRGAPVGRLQRAVPPLRQLREDSQRQPLRARLQPSDYITAPWTEVENRQIVGVGNCVTFASMVLFLLAVVAQAFYRKSRKWCVCLFFHDTTVIASPTFSDAFVDFPHL